MLMQATVSVADIATWHPCADLCVGLDKGAADLIASGAIKVKAGVTPKAFTEQGVLFSGNTELPADVVIYAYVLCLFYASSIA